MAARSRSTSSERDVKLLALLVTSAAMARERVAAASVAAKLVGARALRAAASAALAASTPAVETLGGGATRCARARAPTKVVSPTAAAGVSAHAVVARPAVLPYAVEGRAGGTAATRGASKRTVRVIAPSHTPAGAPVACVDGTPPASPSPSRPRRPRRRRCDCSGEHGGGSKRRPVSAKQM